MSGHDALVGVTFTSGGERLVGVLYLARGESARPTAVVLHGFPGIEKNLDLAAALRDHGWNALVFHYRGCWGSAGPWRPENVPLDVRAAVDFLVTHPRVDVERLVLVGHSGGGWAAVLAAARDERVTGVAVYGAASRIGASQWPVEVVEREFVPWLSISVEEFAAQPWGSPELQPLDHVGALSPRPLLVVHGGEDAWVPVADAEELYARAGEPRRLVVVDGADHGFCWHRTELAALVVGWIDEMRL